MLKGAASNSDLQTGLPVRGRIATFSEPSHLNPLTPNIDMHILLSVLHIFLMVLVGRICGNIKTFQHW